MQLVKLLNVELGLSIMVGEIYLFYLCVSPVVMGEVNNGEFSAILVISIPGRAFELFIFLGK